MSGARATAVVALLLLATVSTAPVGAQSGETEQVIGQPDLDLSIADDRLRPSERRTLSVTVSNGGRLRRGGPAEFVRRVTTARNLKLDVREEDIDAPIEVETGTVVLGAVGSEQPATAGLTVETGDGLRPGTYELPVEVTYDYTSIVTYDVGRGGFENVEFDDGFRRRTLDLEVVVERSPRFDIRTVGTQDLRVDDTGRLDLTVANAGTQRAHDVTVDLSAGSPNLFFGSPSDPTASTSVFIPALDRGETRDISVQIGARGEIEPGTYPVRATVSYENPNGVADASDQLSTGATVRPERRFALRGLETERLRVDSDGGHVTGRIANEGSATARNVVVRLRTTDPIAATGPEAAVGDLAPGASAPVDFRVAVAEDAEPGKRSFAFGVEYENADGDLRSLRTPLREAIVIGGDRDAFTVVGVNTSLRAGGSDRVTVRLRNTGTEPASNAEAKLFVSDPLSSADNGAFLGTVEPGETATAVFRASASGDAQPKAYTGAVEVRYDDPDGDSELADGMRTGIPVAPPDGGPSGPFIVLGAAVALGAVAVYLWRRRSGSGGTEPRDGGAGRDAPRSDTVSPHGGAGEAESGAADP